MKRRFQLQPQAFECGESSPLLISRAVLGLSKRVRQTKAAILARTQKRLRFIAQSSLFIGFFLVSCGEKETALIVPKSDDPDRAALIERAHAAGIHREPSVIREIESLLIAKLKEQELHPKLASLTVTDEEAKNYLSSSSTERPDELQVAVLWFNTRGQQQLVERYRPRLETLKSQISNSPITDGFGQHAITHSEHKASRFKGGKLSWLKNAPTNDPWKQSILTLAQNLQPGELSSITANEHGLFLVRLLERREAPQPSLAQVKNKLLKEKRAALNEEFQMKN